MKIFNVYVVYSDTCGNSDQKFYGCYEAKSKDELEKIFPETHGFIKWAIFEKGVFFEEVPKDLPNQTPKFPKER
jgi:hypothetical protein